MTLKQCVILITNFNSIKVRLERNAEKAESGQSGNFNSIKVRLEHIADRAETRLS